jgi:hypothetical protein
MNFFGISCFTDSAAAEKKTTQGATKSPTESAISNQLAMSHYNLGCTMQEQGKLDEAILNYRNAIDEDASFCDAHYNLANGMCSLKCLSLILYISVCTIYHSLIQVLTCPCLAVMILNIVSSPADRIVRRSCWGI